VKALNDLPRSGRPSRIPVTVRCEVIRLACARPADPPDGKKAKRLPFEQIWTWRSLRDQVAKETDIALSLSEIGRILRCEGLRPHRVRMWLHRSDPDFTVKVLHALAAAKVKAARGSLAAQLEAAVAATHWIFKDESETAAQYGEEARKLFEAKDYAGARPASTIATASHRLALEARRHLDDLTVRKPPAWRSTSR
jgi:hypothetical protein